MEEIIQVRLPEIHFVEMVVRGQFFKTSVGANSRVGANFARRCQLENRRHCCVGANSPHRRKLCFKKLASGDSLNLPLFDFGTLRVKSALIQYEKQCAFMQNKWADPIRANTYNDMKPIL
jgi:hypothetical protein